MLSHFLSPHLFYVTLHWIADFINQFVHFVHPSFICHPHPDPRNRALLSYQGQLTDYTQAERLATNTDGFTN